MNRKKCFKCGKLKSLLKFYRHKKMADGYLGKCKECTKKDSSNHRWSNVEKVRAYDRKRGKSPHRIKENTERIKKYRKRFPLRYKAHTAVNNAVRDGRLKKPKKCSVCSKAGRIEAHHDDYSKPLRVAWACSVCHKRLDKDLRNAS